MILLLACAVPDRSCACPAGVEGFGVEVDEACLCMPLAEPTPEPEGARELSIAEDEPIDWEEVDALLAEGDLVLRFSGSRSEEIEVQRSDSGPSRLVLDGGRPRTLVPSVRTSYEDIVHRVTVRSFEITGGDDKGLYWRGGDGILVEDNLIHHVGGSPALSLDYANRSGHASSGFEVRNNHVFSQRGECIYIGGSEGEDQDAHAFVLIEHNLVHDCVSHLDSRNDGINVKDRIAEVVVRNNVVARTDWGIEVASPDLYEGNVVLEAGREGFQVSDPFAPIGEMLFRDNAVFGAGHDGFHLSVESPAEGLVIEDLLVVEAEQAGLMLGGEAAPELLVRGLRVQDSAVGLDGWGDPSSVEIESCALVGNEQAVDRAFEDIECERAERVDAQPAGPDGLFFSGDEP